VLGEPSAAGSQLPHRRSDTGESVDKGRSAPERYEATHGAPPEISFPRLGCKLSPG
jgi:hypothetical protein